MRPPGPSISENVGIWMAGVLLRGAVHSLRSPLTVWGAGAQIWAAPSWGPGRQLPLCHPVSCISEDSYLRLPEATWCSPSAPALLTEAQARSGHLPVGRGICLPPLLWRPSPRVRGSGGGGLPRPIQCHIF